MDDTRFEQRLRLWLEGVSVPQLEAIERSLVATLIERGLPGWDHVAQAVTELERAA